MESDSRNLILALQGGYEPDVQTMLIVEDIKELVHEVGETNFSFVRRNENHVAHFLSHFCPSEGSEFFWTGEVPEECKILVVNDVRREPIIQ